MSLIKKWFSALVLFLNPPTPSELSLDEIEKITIAMNKVLMKKETDIDELEKL